MMIIFVISTLFFSFPFFMKNLIINEYDLDKYHRSNQDTCMVHRPAVVEGDWVQPGDLLADSSASQSGELTLGKNILIAYMPWEGYNYEDAILISERLVYDDLYTSIHIEKYETEVRDTTYGIEEITKEIPNIRKKQLTNLDKNGIVKVGSWVEEGDILVGKISPIPKKNSQSPYQKLLYTILERKFLPFRDTSLRAPKGIKAKVIEIQVLFAFSSMFQKQKIGKLKNKPQNVNIYLADKRRVQVGDKMAGRHGNKGIISQILPRQDMPYLPDGTPLDMVLNPLGVPSRMNVGQIYECLLGLAGKYLGEYFRIKPFDEIYGAEASRSLAYSKLNEARLKTGNRWLFHPDHPGKIKIFDGRTGEGFDQAITVGVAYMLKLVHLVDDKIHCLTSDHDVLTEQGWISISKVKMTQKVASLNANNQLVYTFPTKVWHYENYKGKLYHIENQQINLTVTMKHRMWVSTVHTRKKIWSDYKFIDAEKIFGKHVKYLKSAEWVQPDFQFYLPNSDIVFPMDAWLTFFGLWVAEGWTQTIKNITNYGLVMLAQVKPNVRKRIENLLQTLGLNYRTSEEKYIISYQPLYQYLKKYSFVSVETEIGHLSDMDLLGDSFQNDGITPGLPENSDQSLFVYRSYNKLLPDWVWRCSQSQCQFLIHGLVLGNGSVQKITFQYYTSSMKLAGDIMRLALHAGWSSNIYLHHEIGKKCGIIKGRQMVAKHDLYRVGINKTKNNPAVNHGHHKTQKIQKELVYDYQGSVYCLEVPQGVFMVRKEGKAVWTGNSRSTGPYSLVTQQPLRGRSKHGGQRLGEMEVWALEGYGAAFVLLEMLTIKSDDISGRMALWSNIILDKEIFIGTPESFKVLVCELQALCLDIGIFRLDPKGVKRQIEHLIKLS
nr:beta subunit of RNA polymerase protein b [Microspora sp. UTEX LB472]